MSTERVGTDGTREPEQQNLIPLTPEEYHDTARKAAICVHELAVMEEEHKAELDARRVQRKRKRAEIEALSSTIRLNGR